MRRAGRGGGRGNSYLKTPQSKKQAPLKKNSSRASSVRASFNLRKDDELESLDDSKDESYEEEDEEEDHDIDGNVVFMRLVNSFVVFVGALACCSAALVVIVVVVLTLFCNAEPPVQNRKRSTQAKSKNDEQNKKLKSTGKLERLLCSKEHHPMFLDCIQAIFSALTTNFFALRSLVSLFRSFLSFSRSLFASARSLLCLVRDFLVNFLVFFVVSACFVSVSALFNFIPFSRISNRLCGAACFPFFSSMYR